MSALRGLMDWYRAQCDGDWEHSYGVRIETLDNPGWSLRIDLGDTELEGRTAAKVKVERSEEDWIHYWTMESRFEAACGPGNLEEAIGAFLDFAAGPGEPMEEGS